MGLAFIFFVFFPIYFTWYIYKMLEENTRQLEAEIAAEKAEAVALVARQGDQELVITDDLDALIEASDQAESKKRRCHINSKGSHLRVVEDDEVDDGYFAIDENVGVDDDAWD